MRRVSSGADHHLGVLVGRQKHRRMIFSERPHFGICDDADDLENMLPFPPHQYLGSNRVGIAEQSPRERLTHESGWRLASVVADIEIAATENGDTENLAE